MSTQPRTRLIAVCAGIAGVSMAGAAPAVADQPPAALGAPITTDLNSTGPLGAPQSPGQASPLPVGGALLGSGLLGGLPAGALPTGALPIGG
ncbi:hypothetical protein QWM81_22680 [Streptomyces ficellus]|uniref:ATP-binding protein n=1 Tax=Streptomyces ficellus TaxID=1977088 RepID=A0ABT7ZCP0_9ACTN|nr:hypothetical protein [Streptomyces ficellus]MDN3296801.1 hypothetical protein [Streptomyces ficellus]